MPKSETRMFKPSWQELGCIAYILLAGFGGSILSFFVVPGSLWFNALLLCVLAGIFTFPLRAILTHKIELTPNQILYYGDSNLEVSYTDIYEMVVARHVHILPEARWIENTLWVLINPPPPEPAPIPEWVLAHGKPATRRYYDRSERKPIALDLEWFKPETIGHLVGELARLAPQAIVRFDVDFTYRAEIGGYWKGLEQEGCEVVPEEERGDGEVSSIRVRVTGWK